ncbi:hypothetical protein J7T55_004602 [Diaporthe amygdali]|uniref:uncharacterized protein n=1 Tax=Phomopsis amygdali TaxID=1214568 RepID=UPI0022FED814|nr:uncharacterized protein J7T55_004602 [Diaporthe amygdali]KAJ0114860.1 hypothetical protein J7T55_004602 [Diaporthe amygdali]
MATADVDHRPVAGDPGQVVVELSSIPQINLQSDSPDLSRSASFQLNPGSGPRSHEGSSTPTTDGLLAPGATQDGQFRKPRFVARDGAIGGKSHNETNVDVVLVPCPGADPHETWMREPLARDFFRRLPTLHHSKVAKWNEQKAITKLTAITPFIGGLVVKLALTQASRSARYRPILEDCYGVTFFATPHRGSSYLSIGDFGMSIQQLLHLPRPLTTKLRGELTPDHPPLLKIDDDFKQLSSEFQVWSFHETEDSELSRIGITGLTDIPFKAPITSMRSAILGVRHEKVYALQSSHANCASFGMKNAQTLRLYLLDLGIAIQKAESLNQNTTHVPLRLEQRVMIEVHGFYETGLANETPGDTSVRLFSTKDHSLEAFWEEGPDGLLEKRLNDIRSESQHDPQDTQFVGQKGRAQSLLSPAKALTGGEEARKKTRRPSVTVVSSGSSSTPADPKSTGSPKRNSLIPEPTASRAANGGDGPPDSQSSPGPGSVRNGSLLQDTGITGPGLTLPRHEDEISSMSRSTTGSETLVSQMSFGAASKTRKFVWIHTPFNNPVWVKKVFDTISLKDRQDYSELFSSENWTSRHERGRHAQHHACFLKPACGYVSLKAKQPSMLFGQTAASGRGLQRNDSSSPRQGCLYLYFPFLHFDSYKMLVKRRDIIKRRAAQGRTRPVPPEVAKDTSLESRVIWGYLGYDPPFNCRRTLDQYRYPSLHDTRARDDDQMLYKMTKERVILNAKPAVASLGPVLRGDERVLTQYDRGDAAGFGDDDDDDQEHLDSESESNEDELDAKPEDDVLDGNVLMVDQLWLWAADTKTLVTFYPSREGSPMEGPLHQQADLRDSVFNEINDELPRPCENALDLAALTVLYAVSALMDRSSHPDLEIFRIFEEAISVLTEKMTSSLKRFRTTGFRNRYGEEDDLKLNSSSIRARHKREDEKAEKENRDNTSALLELRDIEDELSTLNHLFGEQEDQINQMLAIYSGSSTVSSPPTSPPPPPVWGNPVNSPPENNSTGTFPLFGTPLTNNGRVYLQEALNKLKSYRAQAKDMILRVQATRHDFDKLLETVQRQAQIDEVRLSRQQADLASAQNRSVMIFTVFTVIFLPLSFFTSLFGMNTHEWGGGNNIRLRTIGSIALPASALLIIMALFVAWSTSVRKAFKSLSKRIRRTRNRARRWWKKQMAAFWKKNENRPRTRIGRLKMHRKREALEVKRQKNRMKREMTMHDFWERHQLDRETKYEIPSRNRKSISLARAKAKARKEEKERRG